MVREDDADAALWLADAEPRDCASVAALLCVSGRR